ncbi:MAG: Flp1 family type IVb pilin [Lachnospiraceae bacterium]
MDFWNDESAIGVVEIILILVVLIGLVIIFKKQLTSLINIIFNQINQSAGDIYG